ncbi:CxxC-x17-CxxC domain-containing protein, partial [Patescibacteria group bacterium]
LTVDGNSTVRDAVFGNVGTIISFRVGAEDAEFLEKEFEPVFMQNDLINLPKYNVYLKLMIDGVAGDAFSAQALPPVDLSDTAGNEDIIINSSRERYASSRAEIEEKVARWSGFLDEKSVAKMNELVKQGTKTIQTPAAKRATPEFVKPQGSRQVSGVSRPSTVGPRVVGDSSMSSDDRAVKVVEKKEDAPSVEVEKQLYKTKCATCDTEIEVPFKPDGKRPTFCRDCFRDYQRAVAKVRDQADPVKSAQSSTPQSRSAQPSTPQARPAQSSTPQARPAQSTTPQATSAQSSSPQATSAQSSAPQDTPVRSAVSQPRPIQSVSEKAQTSKGSSASGQKSGLNKSVPQSSPKREILTSSMKDQDTKHKAYISEDKPMSLSQMQYVAPKKFKRLEPRREPNKSRIQGLINRNMSKGKEE